MAIYSLSWTRYVMIMDLACDTIMERYLTTLDSPFLRYFFSKTEARKQGNSDTEWYYSTLPDPQDVSTNQIQDSYIILYRIYARDTIFLDLRAYVKVGYATLRDPKIHEFTNFGIPTSNNTRDMIPTLCQHWNTVSELTAAETTWCLN